MPNLAPIDIEDALRLDIMTAAGQGGFSISAPPVPINLGALLPYAVVERIGGTRDELVIDSHMVGVDVWANDWAEAQQTANAIVGYMCSLPYDDSAQHDYLSVNINALPYNNPDPDHADVPRVSFTAQVLVRATEI